MQNARILSIGSYAPDRIMTNDELSSLVDTSDEWIYSHTGIKQRHIADPSQAASDLGIEAAKVAIARAKELDPEFSSDEIDLILCATSTPDYMSFPSTASIIQHKLGINECGAMDLIAACTGFIYAVETAKAFVSSGQARAVLVVAAEIYSRIVDWKDRSSCVLFGDGAGAAIVNSTKKNSKAIIGKGFLRSRGSGAEHLCRPAGGSRKNYIPGETPEKDLFIYMNGRQVYVFAVQAIIDGIKEVLKINELKMEEIDYILPHQANRRIIEAACEREGWPLDKFIINMDKYANTSAASIPLAFEELYSTGRAKAGTKILTVGFGAGLTYGGNYFII